MLLAILMLARYLPSLQRQPVLNLLGDVDKPSNVV